MSGGAPVLPIGGGCRRGRLQSVLDGSAEAGFLVCSGVPVENTPLHRLINPTEGNTDTGGHQFPPCLIGMSAIGCAGPETFLHQSPHPGVVHAVAQPVALSNGNTLLCRFDVGQRG